MEFSLFHQWAFPNMLWFEYILWWHTRRITSSGIISGVTILLSLTVFLNMVSATMPVTSDNPLLGKWSEMKDILQQLQPMNQSYQHSRYNPQAHRSWSSSTWDTSKVKHHRACVHSQNNNLKIKLVQVSRLQYVGK